MTAQPFQYTPPAFVDDETRPLPTHAQDLIVGSGPAASVVANYLARAGRHVTILEEGPARKAEQYGGYALSDVFGQMYRSSGGLPVLGGPSTPPMVLVIARCKGGGTVVNGAVCYRTTSDVVEGWRDDIGLSHIATELWRGYERAEQRIGVTSMANLHSASTLKVRAGADKLGWAHHDVHRNTPDCIGTARCLAGCARNAKQSMLLNYLKDAEEAGAVVYPDTHVNKLEGDFGRVRAVKGTRAGKPFRVTAERVFLAAGAVFSPFLMLRSGIKHLRAIGRHLTVHPSTRAYYMFDEPVNAWNGAFQSFAVHEFRKEGIHIINLMPPPNVLAASLPAVGPELRELMTKLPHMGVMGALISDKSEGRVFATPFRNFPAVQYTMSHEDRTKLIKTIGLLGELGFASGAKEIYLPFNWRPSVKNHQELRAQLASNVAPHDLEVTAQHPLGTCRMGYDEDLSVVREDGRVHGYDNLHVIDSSVIPTSIGVNPMLTVLAFAEVIGQSLVN